MHLFIYNLQGPLYEGDTTSVSLPAEDGEITVLPNHAPLVTALKNGVIKIKNDSEDKIFGIKKGFAYIDGKSAIILSD